MANNKSQIAMELLVLIGFLFLIAIGFIISAGIQLKNFQDEKTKNTFLDFSNMLRLELQTASTVMDGYIRNITLPEKIDGIIEYQIDLKNSTIIIISNNFEESFTITNLEGNINKGKNTIKKINESIIIN